MTGLLQPNAPKTRPTGAHCLAPGCTNSRRNNKRLLYQHLPLADKLPLDAWMACRDEVCQTIIWSWNKLECAVTMHFTIQDYESSDSGRLVMQQTSPLKPTAVPTLFDFSGCSKGNGDAPSRSTPRLLRPTLRVFLSCTGATYVHIAVFSVATQFLYRSPVNKRPFYSSLL